jgi:glycopeptide antibiotics resistance protein
VRALLSLIIAGYLVAVTVITLWPLQFDVGTQRLTERGNWIPGRGTLAFLRRDDELSRTIGGRDFLANVILYAPLGFLMPLRLRGWRGIVESVLLLCVLSFVLEVIQGIAVAFRTLDVDDAIAGAAGATAAVLAAVIVRPMAIPRR